MQVTETLSEGLKRAYTVVVPAADIESRRAARLKLSSSATATKYSNSRMLIRSISKTYSLYTLIAI